MFAKLSVILAIVVGVLFVGRQDHSVRAQQAFLPPMFQLGAKIVLGGDSDKVYTVLSQQGAWIRVAVTKSGVSVADDTETWIYAPSGTIWMKAR